MPYIFNGSDGCEKIINHSGTYEAIKTPIDMYNALQNIWCEYTCAPRLREKWSVENKTAGQCSITAFLTQDIFGGEVYGIRTERGVHCYNVVEGHIFDLTSEQYGEDAKNLVYDICVDEKQERNSAYHFGKEEKLQRYLYLKNALEGRA